MQVTLRCARSEPFGITRKPPTPRINLVLRQQSFVTIFMFLLHYVVIHIWRHFCLIIYKRFIENFTVATFTYIFRLPP